MSQYRVALKVIGKLGKAVLNTIEYVNAGSERTAIKLAQNATKGKNPTAVDVLATAVKLLKK
jgi:hypothetical protein